MKLKEVKETIQMTNELAEMIKENKKLKEKFVEKIKEIVFKNKENINFEIISFRINNDGVSFYITFVIPTVIFDKIFRFLVRISNDSIRIEIIDPTNKSIINFIAYDNEIIKYFKDLCLELYKEYNIKHLELHNEKIKKIKNEYEEIKYENEILKEICDMQ